MNELLKKFVSFEIVGPAFRSDCSHLVHPVEHKYLENDKNNSSLLISCEIRQPKKGNSFDYAVKNFSLLLLTIPYC